MDRASRAREQSPAPEASSGAARGPDQGPPLPVRASHKFHKVRRKRARSESARKEPNANEEGSEAQREGTRPLLPTKEGRSPGEKSPPTGRRPGGRPEGER